MRSRRVALRASRIHKTRSEVTPKVFFPSLFLMLRFVLCAGANRAFQVRVT